VCGMTAHGMCGRFKIFESARHFLIEFELGRLIRIRIESRSFACPYFWCRHETIRTQSNAIFTCCVYYHSVWA